MRWLVSSFFYFWVRLARGIYGGDGINVPLRFMPTQLIAQTLRAYGAEIGGQVRFRSPLVIHNSGATSFSHYGNLRVGHDCYFGRELFLDLQDRIVIEDNVTISHRVMILTHTDGGTTPLRDVILETSCAPVTIRRGAYVGANATILQGVEIGEEAVIGAGALVIASVPARSVAVGVPAKVVKTLTGTV
jgi:acetyltransferase-like isoleucine patch superfamily enzyme